MAISVEGLEHRLSDVEVPVLKKRGATNGRVATASPREIFRNYADVIPPEVRVKLGAKKANGDRSRVLWRLSNKLLEAGLSPGETVILLEKTVWNKFEDDRSRLWADVSKAAQRASDTSGRTRSQKGKGSRPTKGQPRDRKMPWAVPLDRYLATESQDPRWMVDGLWSDKSHGIVAGEPKTRKSYFAIDLALSVATGTSVFGHFDVMRPGPVMMIQEEISDAEMRKRLRFISEGKELGGKVDRGDNGTISLVLPSPIPFWLRNRQGFDLSKDESYHELEKEVNDRKISLLILDPLQMMLGTIDENRASEVRPVLRNLLQLKEATGCGILIVHHYGKDKEKRGGQRLLGSQAFHGWVESALYLTKPEPLITHVEREFRNFEPMPDFEVEYTGGNEGYAVAVEVPKDKVKGKKDPFEQFCLQHPRASVKALAAHFKVSDATIRRRAEKSKFLELRKFKSKTTGRPVMGVTRVRVEM